MKRLLSLLLVVLTSPAWGASQFDRVVRQSSFEQIQATTNYLLVVVENGMKDPRPKPLFKCEPKPDQAQAWLSGPMHAMSDAKEEVELKAYKAKPKSFATRFRNCAKTCSCSAFTGLLDEAEEALKENKDHQLNRKILTPLAEKETAEKSAECAKSYRAFCGGRIEKLLKAEY